MTDEEQSLSVFFLGPLTLRLRETVRLGFGVCLESGNSDFDLYAPSVFAMNEADLGRCQTGESYRLTPTGGTLPLVSPDGELDETVAVFADPQPIDILCPERAIQTAALALILEVQDWREKGWADEAAVDPALLKLWQALAAQSLALPVAEKKAPPPFYLALHAPFEVPPTLKGSPKPFSRKPNRPPRNIGNPRARPAAKGRRYDMSH